MKPTTRKILPLLACFAAGAAGAQTPAQITPPRGHAAVLTLSATGDLTYECKASADQPGAFAWTFVGPNAKLWDVSGNEVGRYYAGPTWESADGSKVTGKQLAVVAGPAGAIPLQLVQASPAMGQGRMTGVTYVQRLKTVGGVAPSSPACTAGSAGATTTVPYSADYVFFKKA